MNKTKNNYKNFKLSAFAILAFSAFLASTASNNAFAVTCEMETGVGGFTNGYGGPGGSGAQHSNTKAVNYTTLKKNFETIFNERSKKIEKELDEKFDLQNEAFEKGSKHFNFVKLTTNSVTTGNLARFNCSGITISADNANKADQKQLNYLVRYDDDGNIINIEEEKSEGLSIGDFTGHGIKDSEQYKNHINFVGESLIVKNEENKDVIHKNISTELKAGKDGNNINNLIFKLNSSLKELESLTFTVEKPTDKPVILSKLGLDNGNHKVINVADGDITETSKDAVNGSQLYKTNNRLTIVENDILVANLNIEANKKQIEKNKDNILVNANNIQQNKQDIKQIQQNFIELQEEAKDINVTKWRNKLGINENGNVGDFVEYTTNEETGIKSINLYSNNGAGTKINNVADGEISPTSKEAVNGSQLYRMEQSFNKKIDGLNEKIKDTDKRAQGGIANAVAMSSIPQVTENGKGMIGVGLGNGINVGSVAIGYSQKSDNGKMIFKLNSSINTNGKANFGVGFGYQF